MIVCVCQSGRIGADEVIDDAEGKDTEELDELIKEKEAKTQAILLEMVSLSLSLSVPLHPCLSFSLYLTFSVCGCVCSRWAICPTQT